MHETARETTWESLKGIDLDQGTKFRNPNMFQVSLLP
jgi:hypothetical protein